MVWQFFRVFFLVALSVIGSAQDVGWREAGESRITLENCRMVNSPGPDLGPAIYRDTLIYVTRPRRGAIDPATRLPYFRLFAAPLSDDGLPGRGQRLHPADDEAHNAGPVSFDGINQVAYLTRSPAESDGPTIGRAKEGNLGIFQSTGRKENWSAVQPMPHNDPGYTNQHPAVTPDGQRIFFASNRPGGYGGYDLYFADRRNDDWGPAINLGPDINTAGNETNPYFHLTAQLFFASDGRGGLGGYDIYGIDLSERAWGKVSPLPEPVNSPANETGFILSEEATHGYLVSDRPGGQGMEDIYRVALPDGLESIMTDPPVQRNLTVFDRASSKRLVGAYVWVSPYSTTGRLPGSQGFFVLDNDRAGQPATIIQRPLGPEQLSSREAATTDLSGRFGYAFQPGASYRISIRKDGYVPETFDYREGYTDLPALDVSLHPEANRGMGGLPAPSTPASQWVGATLRLPEIRYPYLSANPIYEASPDLEVLHAFLATNPGVNVLLIVHADGPEPPETLARLAEERAVRLRRFVVGRGVEGTRVKTVSYGDRYPVSQCEVCTEADYRRNSRIEAKVIAWE